MNRMEFLTELERLLSGMPEDERQAAVQYYADYLADAGEENEADAIRELGSPEKVAESIKADYYGTEFDEAKFDHKNYMEKYGQRSGEHGQGNGADGAGTQSAQNGAKGPVPGQKKEPWTSNGLKLLLIALIVIVAGPVALGIAGTILGVIACVFCLFIGLVIAAVAFMICGIVLAFVGVIFVATPAAAMVVAGFGVLFFVLGLAGTVGMVKLCMIVFPAMVRGFVELCRKPFHRKAVR